MYELGEIPARTGKRGGDQPDPVRRDAYDRVEVHKLNWYTPEYRDDRRTARERNAAHPVGELKKPHRRNVSMIRIKKELIVVGDRLLLALDEGQDKTKSGLYLPASVREKDKVASGRVVKVGPGYPIPNPNYTEDEPWSSNREPMRYIPLQAREGDYAIFLREQGIEVEFEEAKYLIVPQSAVLMLMRSELHEE